MTRALRQIAMTAAFHYCAANRPIVLVVQLMPLLFTLVLWQLVGGPFLPPAVAGRILRGGLGGVWRRGHDTACCCGQVSYVDCHKSALPSSAVENKM